MLLKQVSSGLQHVNLANPVLVRSIPEPSAVPQHPGATGP